MNRSKSFIAVSLALSTTLAHAQLKPSFGTQLKLGKEAAAELRKKEKVLPSSDRRVVLLRELGAKAIAQIPEKERKARPYEFTFDVIDSKEVNAFALPGGPVFFYTGLLEKMTTVDQVAGIIGHEITHVRLEHWARQVEDANKKAAGVTILNEIFRGGKIGEVAGNVVLALDQLKYSRKHEIQADGDGFVVVSGMGYNPQGMIDVFRMFEQMKGKGGDPEIMKTHPDDKKRIQRLEDLIKKSKRTYPAQVKLPWTK